MQSGPIQVLAFAFDRVDRFEGQILRELDELRGHGLIRVMDGPRAPGSLSAP